MIRATKQIHKLGQSLWVDGINRDRLEMRKLERYIAELSVTAALERA
jgi:hypothetical protein